MSEWYAVHCRPCKEKQAARALQHTLNLRVYFPEIRRQHRHTKQEESYPLFPCYLFVQTDLRNVRRDYITRMPGVVQLVGFHGTPMAVPSGVIEELLEQVNTINERGGTMEHGFQAGDLVRLKRGPMRGLEGIFEGPMEPSERVRILIEFMGHLNRVEVGADMLEHTSPQPSAHRQRRTRGKGRRIKTRADEHGADNGTS
jgi:transcription antitermination factor NusG